MPTILATMNGPVAIRQRMQAGSNFNGAAPNDGAPLLPTFADYIYKFGAGTAGGLFAPWGGLYSFRPGYALYLLSVELILDSGTSWTLVSEDPDGYPASIATGTGSYFAGVHATMLPYPILPNGVLKLTSTGASAALTARLKFAHGALCG